MDKDKSELPALPWEAHTLDGAVLITGGNRELVAMIPRGTPAEVAPYLVQVANTHQQLITAASCALESINSTAQGEGYIDPELDAAQMELARAVAAAETSCHPLPDKVAVLARDMAVLLERIQKKQEDGPGRNADDTKTLLQKAHELGLWTPTLK